MHGIKKGGGLAIHTNEVADIAVGVCGSQAAVQGRWSCMQVHPHINKRCSFLQCLPLSLSLGAPRGVGVVVRKRALCVSRNLVDSRCARPLPLLGRCMLFRSIWDLDVVEIILADSFQCVPIYGDELDSQWWKGELAHLCVHMPPTTVSKPKPVKAFLNRYGRRARISAGPWRYRRS
jgi:hypothetical protein